jgi:hypothetical protein
VGVEELGIPFEVGVELVDRDLEHFRPLVGGEVQVGLDVRDFPRFGLRVAGFEGRHVGVHRTVEERLQARTAVLAMIGSRPVGEDPGVEVDQPVGGFRPDDRSGQGLPRSEMPEGLLQLHEMCPPEPRILNGVPPSAP